MARWAVLASGNGSNFENLVKRLRDTEHRCEVLACDKPDAPVLERARRLGVSVMVSDYTEWGKQQAEGEILTRFHKDGVSLVVLAGFMRILSPSFVDSFPNRIVNIHPSLLPRHPGRDAIRKSYLSGDDLLGITIHLVDQGVDSGPILAQKSFRRSGMDFAAVEARVHDLEHEWFPLVVRELLDGIDAGKPEGALK